MSFTQTEIIPSFTTIELQTPYGLEHRRVSTKLPRDCRPDEIPIIDINGISDSAAMRLKVATEVKSAAENSGFFYIQNHGIDEDIIDNALQASKRYISRLVRHPQC